MQANRALFVIKSKKDKHNLPIDIMLDLFDKMILPILSYGCEIWGFEDLNRIEIFFKKILKYMLRINRQTTDCMVYGETGRLPLDITIKTRMISFWHKTATGLNTKHSYRLLYLLNKLYDNRQFASPWLKHVEGILNSCGMRNVWLNPKDFKLDWLKKSIPLKLSDTYKQKWRRLAAESSSCIFYRSFKTDFNLEKYQTVLDYPDRRNA